ncbi:MAG: hypothetical protein ACJ8LI_00845 [Chthoniobacterales bacterium]
MDVTGSGRRPLVIYALIALFWFGVAMSLLTAFLLLFPATPLDVLWRIKPEAKGDLVVFGYAAVLLMLIVAIACAFAAVGVTSRAEWGRLTAMAILSANLFGDCINATLRNDLRTLIGLPIAGALIWYLVSARGRRYFKTAR